MDDDDTASPDDSSDDSLLRELAGMAPRVAPIALALGQVLDDAYRIDALLGKGGMGRVYRARDLRLHRDVAVKVHASVTQDDRLMREASALAQLVHPHVVTVFEVGRLNGHPWVAMEYVSGGTARTWLEKAQRSVREILDLYAAAARGLAAAHAVGLVHRDFKPDNVLVGDDGRVRVADFGLARLSSEAGTIATDRPPAGNLTVTGARMGTPAYMAPEQIAGQPVGAAADQYALATAVWEAIAGERPAREGPLAAPAAMPRRIEKALRRALEPDPEKRWPTVSALADVLALRPRRLVVATAALALVALGGASWAFTHRDDAIDCETFGATTWTPLRAATLHARLMTHSMLSLADANRAVGILDTWDAARARARIDACTATHVQHTQSPIALDARLTCLDRAARELEVTSEVLADLPLKARDRASLIARALPRVDECVDDYTTAPTEPAARLQYIAITDAMIESDVLIAAGNKRALDKARFAVAAADRLGNPGLQADARLKLQTATAEARGPTLANVDLCAEAARFAAEAKSDPLVALAWTRAFLIVVDHGKPDEARRLEAVAEAAVIRAGNTPRLRAQLLDARAWFAHKLGDNRKARDLGIETLELAGKGFGAEDERFALFHTHLATAYIELRDDASARRELTTARALLERLYGETNPHLGAVLNQLGTLEYHGGHNAEARVAYARALLIKERANGPAHISLAPALINLGLAVADTGELDAAQADADRARALIEHAYGADSNRMILVYALEAHVAHLRKSFAAERTALARAIALQTKVGDVPPQDELLGRLSAADLALGDVAGARGAADRALAIAKRGADPVALALATEHVGWVEHAEGAPTARATLDRALAMLKQAVGDADEDTVRLAGWLADRERMAHHPFGE